MSIVVNAGSNDISYWVASAALLIPPLLAPDVTLASIQVDTVSGKVRRAHSQLFLLPLHIVFVLHCPTTPTITTTATTALSPTREDSETTL